MMPVKEAVLLISGSASAVAMVSPASSTSVVSFVSKIAMSSWVLEAKAYSPLDHCEMELR
jgi:hypothetical protein